MLIFSIHNRGKLMTWGKLAGLFSLKAILLACILTPVTVTTTGITAAQAQFQIIIPGFGYQRGYRRYGRGYRHGRRSSRRGGGQPSAGADQNPAAGSSGKPGVR